MAWAASVAEFTVQSKPADWTFTFGVNVVGVVRTVQAFVPLLKRSKAHF